MADNSSNNNSNSNVLNEFKQRLKDVITSTSAIFGQSTSSRYSHLDLDKMMKDDAHLLRFLRAREFNVDNAEIMYRNMIKWRKETNAHSVIERVESSPDFQFCQKYLPLCFYSRDKVGRPFRIDQVGKIDVKGVFHHIGPEYFLLYLLYLGELGMMIRFEESVARNSVVEGNVVLMDLEGVSISQHMYSPVVSIFKESVHVLQDNYPEALNKMFIINSPSVFSVIWAVIKPWLTPVTQAKIEIVGSTGYFDNLSKLVDVENIPALYGGSGKTPLAIGGTIPGMEDVAKIDGRLNHYLMETYIAAGSSFKIPVKVDSVHSRLTWSFNVKDAYDVTFSVLQGESVENGKEIIAASKVTSGDSHLPIKVTQPTTFILLFDNSHSWMYSKTVNYKAKLV